WSQTHPDRGDGFCTEPYVFDANNTDYLPLHYFEGTPLYAPAVISSPGHYVLMNNLVNSSVKSAISINSSDVYLDGGGHLLDGISAEDTAGVSMGNGNLTFSNITVKNLVVTGWAYGVSTDKIENSSISDVLATGNLEGIAITDSTGCEIQNSTIRENIPWMDAGISMGGNGIMVSGSRGTRITRVNISDNGWSPHPPWVGGYGVNILNSSGSRISDCTVIKNINTGIWVEQSKDVSVVNNEIRDNSGNGGIFMTTVTTDPVMNCTLAGNTVSGSSYGIWLTRDSITVLDNTIDNCINGIFLENCQNATLAGNVMTENSINFAVVALTNMDYNHQIATSNTVDGKPVYYLVGKPDAVINSTTNAGVVYGISCPNITIRDLSLTHNGYGVFLLDSDDVTVENVTSTENVVGIAIRESNETRINQCTARENSGRGIMVESSENVLISDSVASQNIDPAGDAGIGITVKDTNRVIIEGVNASLNSLYGVEISNTNQVLLTDVTGAMNSEAGFVIQGVSIEISDCHIRDNTEVGIGMLDSGHVLIWNNYFSNDLNFAYGEGAVTVPAWNITKTFGTNIAGGPYVGGNYWANPAGTGWSQTHPDRGDGFTEPYVIAANNTDFLPLHKGPGSARMSIPNASIYQNTNTPLPVRVTNMSHATGISFNLTYDPAVIRVNEITLNQSYADGSSLSVNATPGLLRISLTCTNPITIAQPIPVFFINTTSTTPVGSSSPLDIDSAGWGDESFNLRSFDVVNGSVLVYRIRGDLNGNHWVDIGDTAKTAYMVVNLTPHLVPDADFNNNGRIDTGDASMIACYLVGKIGDL
ncbi:MAG: NosD domain-containing protein, partial [Methanoregula sp.]|nr:NosD domain-containing protein [Methanoregula sp.]